MEWLIPSVIASLTGTIVLSIVYSYLAITEKSVYIKIWAAGWWLYCFRYICMLIMMSGSESQPIFAIGYLLFSLISGFFLLWGTFEFQEKKMHPSWLIFTGIIEIWIIWGQYAKFSFLIYTIPTFSYLGIIYIWAGLALIQKKGLRSHGVYVTGSAFILWGIHKFNYPFLRPVTWFAPWGYLLNSLFELSVAFGIILIYFEENKNTLLETLENLKVNQHLMTESQKIAHIGSWHFDIKKNILTWSEEMYRIFGRKPDEFESTYEAFLETVHPEDREMVNKTYTKAILAKNPYECVHRIIRNDGQVRVVLEKSEDITDDKGTVIHSYGYSQDITERCLENEKYELIIRTSIDGFWLVDTNLNIVDVNDAYCKMSGYRRDEILEMTIVDFEAKESYQDVNARMSRLKDNQSDRFESRHRRKDGTIFDVEISTNLFHSTNPLVVVFIRDISQKKIAEHEKTELEQKLRQSQKMEAVGTLAGGIAHDFNNLLGVIMGYSELALADSEMSDIKKNLGHILTASERAKDLVSQILTFSRRSNPKRVTLNITKIICETISMLRATIPSNIEIRFDFDREQYHIMGDHIQFQQIILNLCTNAAHAMEPSGGFIHIKLNQYESKQNEKYPDLPIGEYLELTVCDTGTGISSDIMDKIFDPYFTTKKFGSGSGMGLAIVHGIVTDLGGKISVDSVLNKGTIFKILLPHLHTAGEQTEVRNENFPEGKGKILFVDDEELLTTMTKLFLEKLGYNVIVELNGIDAWKTFQKSPYDFKAVITDQTMPGLSGIELARNIMQINPETNIILCSGYLPLINEQEVKEIGIKVCLEKPVNLKELSRLLNS